MPDTRHSSIQEEDLTVGHAILLDHHLSYIWIEEVNTRIEFDGNTLWRISLHPTGQQNPYLYSSPSSFTILSRVLMDGNENNSQLWKRKVMQLSAGDPALPLLLLLHGRPTLLSRRSSWGPDPNRTKVSPVNFLKVHYQPFGTKQACEPQRCARSKLQPTQKRGWY